MSLSLLQVRNVAQNTLLKPVPSSEMTPEEILSYHKREFRVTVPNSTIQTLLVGLQAATTDAALLALLPGLRDAIDAIIPPVHTPTSLSDILSELRRFQGLADPIDQQILFIGYLPMINLIVDVKPLREALGTPGQSDAIETFVLDYASRLTTLKKQMTEESPAAPPFANLLAIPEQLSDCTKRHGPSPVTDRLPQLYQQCYRRRKPNNRTSSDVYIGSGILYTVV
jgi:hypothetical protein